jgi:hypothetical protein
MHQCLGKMVCGVFIRKDEVALGVVRLVLVAAERGRPGSG